jgi:S1-C subfamily serine protease
MERIAQFTGRLLLDLAGDTKRPDYIKVKRGAAPARGNMSAYTGVIPDYSAEVDGLQITDVSAGGPAAKAGIKGGDIVIEFDGKTIKNIYDYTAVLGAIKAGKETKITILRAKKKVELKITPTRRK